MPTEAERQQAIIDGANIQIVMAISVPSRLRMVRETLQWQIRYLQGGSITADQVTELREDWRRWQFQEDVRNEAQRLINNPAFTVADAVWPVLSSYAMPSLPSFWSTGIVMGTVSGLTAALAGKYPTPSGTTSQYVRGDGTLFTFPAIPAAQVNSDWNASSGLPQILNKPALATVATSGAYSDIGGKPTIPPAITLTTTGTSGASTFNGATGALNIPQYANSGGTVTSVGLTAFSGISVAGSPITGSGTLAISTALSGMLYGTGSAFATATITAPISYSAGTLSHATAGTAGTYGSATSIPVITTNATGHVTGVTATTTTGRLELIGTTNITQTLLVSLSAGLQDFTVTLSGIGASDALMCRRTGPTTSNGVAVGTMETQNVIATGTNTCSVRCNMPALGIGVTYVIPIAIYRIT